MTAAGPAARTRSVSGDDSRNCGRIAGTRSQTRDRDMLLVPHAPLAETTRLPHFAGGRAAWREFVVLLAFGAAAAALTTYVRLGIRVPGQSNLHAVIPIALALAVVPRCNAGSVAGTARSAGRSSWADRVSASAR